MKPASPSFDPEIDRQALAWFERSEGGLSPAQKREFESWLAADTRHLARYAELDEIWALMAGLKSRGAGDAEKAGTLPARPQSGRRIWWSVGLAAAAVLAFGIFHSRPLPSRPARDEVVATGAGGFKKVELADGSVVRLNADTSIAINLSAHERRIDLLQGEAHFTVAKDPNRPFIVAVPGHSVRAVGTVFDVSLWAARFEVLVTEGRVRVAETGKTMVAEPDAGVHLLGAGQRAIVALPASAAAPEVTVAPVSDPEVEQALAWQVRLLEFDERPLSEVVREFNRYNQHQLEIADASLAAQTFGGKLRADNYEDLVLLLEQRFHVVAERSGNKTVLRVKKS